MRRVLKCGGVDKKTIKIDMVPSVYDLQELVEIDHGFYCLENENRSIAAADVLFMNTFIDQARQVCPEFPANYFTPDINFDYHETPIRPVAVGTLTRDDGTTVTVSYSQRDYVMLKVAPLTPKGKPPKYPLSIVIASMQQPVFGEVFYGRNKTVQRAELVSWCDHVHYNLIVADHDGDLGVHLIYRTSIDDFKKVKLYEYQAEGEPS